VRRATSTHASDVAGPKPSAALRLHCSCLVRLAAASASEGSKSNRCHGAGLPLPPPPPPPRPLPLVLSACLGLAPSLAGPPPWTSRWGGEAQKKQKQKHVFGLPHDDAASLPYPALKVAPPLSFFLQLRSRPFSRQRGGAAAESEATTRSPPRNVQSTRAPHAPNDPILEPFCPSRSQRGGRGTAQRTHQRRFGEALPKVIGLRSLPSSGLLARVDWACVGRLRYNGRQARLSWIR
jgi:hypothetical protein